MDGKSDGKLQILEANLCEVCQQPALHKCGGCRRVCYCSKQHQRDHWRQHKTVCKPFKTDEWCVHNRLFNPRFEEKFK